MRCILLAFDSLNRHFLPPYGNTWVHAPNFQRLARRTVQFDRAYCGSMPCMPARRELHTGRPNFLHAPWGALDVYDESAVSILRSAGIHTHLTSDHYHYWEENAATYHTRFTSWEFIRGQEGDPWIGQVGPHHEPDHINGKGRPQDWINRPFITKEADSPTPKTIDAGIAHLRRNAGQDNWFLQLECFDPHEPFCFDPKFKDLYPDHFKNYRGPLFDWPPYGRVKDQTPEQIEHLRHNYAATLSQTDAALGRFLDAMDELDLWKDTMLIVWTDHGHMLGEKGHFAKNYQPWWEELSHIPLWIWDPRRPDAAGERRRSLVQTIDLAPTVLDFFGQPPSAHATGILLREVIASDTAGRAAGLFGNFGNHVNVTDGRFVYLRASEGPDDAPLFGYTLLPLGFRGALDRGHPIDFELVDPLPFTRGQRVLRIRHHRHFNDRLYGTLLYDLETDPGQENPLHESALEKRMIDLLVEEMRRNDAPPEQFLRLGLPA
ncbi:MAG: sulfatase [Puniceicoccaceae bacterium]|nr:MAG: sulfatase [Puniceicoccaceae bacterium]